jgi:hypothetical protein
LGWRFFSIEVVARLDPFVFKLVQRFFFELAIHEIVFEFILELVRNRARSRDRFWGLRSSTTPIGDRSFTAATPAAVGSLWLGTTSRLAPSTARPTTIGTTIVWGSTFLMAALPPPRILPSARIPSARIPSARIPSARIPAISIAPWALTTIIACRVANNGGQFVGYSEFLQRGTPTQFNSILIVDANHQNLHFLTNSEMLADISNESFGQLAHMAQPISTWQDFHKYAKVSDTGDGSFVESPHLDGRCHGFDHRSSLIQLGLVATG